MNLTAETLGPAVDRALRETAITDIHTHIYDPRFGDLLLWGVDELLTYHYVVAEAFRWLDIPYEDYGRMPRKAQADLVWKTLFLDRSPVSEAARGVLETLAALGLDAGGRDLDAVRRWFAGRKPEAHLDDVFRRAGLKDVVMTNDPFDDRERPIWASSAPPDPRFHAALRIDPLLLDWASSCGRLKGWGYDVEPSLAPRTLEEVKRFLRDWAGRMKPLYAGVSLPPAFTMPESSPCATLIEKALLPVMAELGLPFALMIGVKRRTNPALGLAGDSVGRARIESVEHLCAAYPHNKFMVTMLSRENQHELCVAARKFRNLLVFGCWWYINNTSLIRETTRMRFEMLGTSFIPQHSDARVLEQVIYKWDVARRLIGGVLREKYADLLATGWALDEAAVHRDVAGLLGGNFWSFLGRRF